MPHHSAATSQATGTTRLLGNKNGFGRGYYETLVQYNRWRSPLLRRGLEDMPVTIISLSIHMFSHVEICTYLPNLRVTE